MDEYCRVCSRCDGFRKFSLATVSQISGVRIDDMLVYCTQQEVTTEDCLPQQICAACLTSLNSAFAFRKLCYHSVIAFQASLKPALPVSDNGIPFEPHLDPMPDSVEQCSNKAEEITIKEECIEAGVFFESIAVASKNNEIVSEEEPIENLVTEYEVNGNRKHFLTLHICKECGYTTSSSFNLKRHQKIRKHFEMEKIRSAKPKLMIKRKMGEKDETKAADKYTTLYSCEKCSYQTHSSSNFKTHQTQHIELPTCKSVSSKVGKTKPSYKCPHCGLFLSTKNCLQNHIQKACEILKASKPVETTHQPKPCLTGIKEEDKKLKLREEFRCTECGKIVTSKIALATHMFHKCRGITNERSASDAADTIFFCCDFCNYKTPKKTNLMRHHRKRCYDLTYMNEIMKPNIFLNDTLKQTLNDSQQITEFKLESGESIFSADYVKENHESDSTSRPPFRLIESIDEFEYCLVLTMRGVRCCGCSMFFEDEDALAKHQVTEHPMRPLMITPMLQCGSCSQPFYKIDSYEYHEKLAQSKTLIFCTSCEQMIIGSTAWFSHCNLQHGKIVVNDCYEKVIIGKNLRCCNCDMLQPSQAALDVHLKEFHFPQKLCILDSHYECERCFKQFKTLAQLETHQEVRNAKKFYRCLQKYCRMEFKCEKDVITHAEICINPEKHCKDTAETDDRLAHESNNDNEKAIKSRKHRVNSKKTRNKNRCNFCGKRFPRMETLRKHVLIHKNFPKYDCPHCPFQTKFQGKLHTHALTHIKSHPYACRCCGKPFQTLQKRQIHEKKFHLKHSNHKCNECSSRFATGRTLRIHQIKCQG